MLINVLASGMSLGSAWATTPPERPPAVEGECPEAYALTKDRAPSSSLIDPATGKAVCGGVLIPTSLVAYYVELESWSSVVVLEVETLKAERPTFWSKWGERIQYVGIGVGVGVAVGVAASR